MTCIRHGLLPLLSSPSLSLSYTVQLPPHPTHKFALISHPLARLGGSSRDHVVRSLAAALGEAGWGVVTYDSRGAGRSGGSCSFSSVLPPSSTPLRSPTDTITRRTSNPVGQQKQKITPRSSTKSSSPSSLPPRPQLPLAHTFSSQDTPPDHSPPPSVPLSQTYGQITCSFPIPSLSSGLSLSSIPPLSRVDSNHLLRGRWKRRKEKGEG